MEEIKLKPEITKYTFEVESGDRLIYGTLTESGISSPDIGSYDLTVYSQQKATLAEFGKEGALPVMNMGLRWRDRGSH